MTGPARWWHRPAWRRRRLAARQRPMSVRTPTRSRHRGSSTRCCDCAMPWTTTTWNAGADRRDVGRGLRPAEFRPRCRGGASGQGLDAVVTRNEDDQIELKRSLSEEIEWIWRWPPANLPLVRLPTKRPCGRSPICITSLLDFSSGAYSFTLATGLGPIANCSDFAGRSWLRLVDNTQHELRLVSGDATGGRR